MNSTNSTKKRIPFVFLGIFVLLISTIATLYFYEFNPEPKVKCGTRYFHETGHYLSGEFCEYYLNASDPELVFGYPITEAFMKNGRLVQYFQRARFELHTDLPAGQRVKLTPIGKEMYVPGGERLDIFNPFACRYFTQTGFSVCYAFLDFFKANGGVDRFGQPISPFEYRDNLIIQYFENARFEWKPWLPEGQRVSVADLGRPYFDKQKEDPNLLRPIPGNRPGGTLSQLQVRAFVWKAGTLASDQQLIYIIVQDQTLQPVSGAQGTATIRWADGTSGTLTFSTNTSGVGIVPLTFVNQPYGKTVIIEIAVTKDGLSTTTTTSFRITKETNPIGLTTVILDSELQEDGTVKTDVELSIESMGIGQLEITAPNTLQVGEANRVQLIIFPDSAMSNLPIETKQTSISTPNNTEIPNDYLAISDSIQIYPVMRAELEGSGFEIIPVGTAEKAILSNSPTEWQWIISPTQAGNQSLVLLVSIPIVINNEQGTISTQPIKYFPLDILVIPPSTPTPLPPAKQIAEQLSQDSGIIIVSIIGLIGTISAAIIAVKSKKKTRVTKKGKNNSKTKTTEKQIKTSNSKQ